ncbi:MAG: KH domain-containing protein [Elusimicrobiales bacterium]
MDSLLAYIIKGICENYRELKLMMIEADNDIRFNISIPRSLRHRIIGKDGKVISSIRDYLKVVSRKFQGKKIFINVNEI